MEDGIELRANIVKRARIDLACILSMAFPPIQGSQLIGKDHARDPGTFRYHNLERVTLRLGGYGAREHKADFPIVSHRRQDEDSPTVRFFRARMRRAHPDNIASLRCIRVHHPISLPSDGSSNSAEPRLDASISKRRALRDAFGRLARRITKDPSESERTTAVPSLTWVSSANAFGIRRARLLPQRWIVVFNRCRYNGYPIAVKFGLEEPKYGCPPHLHCQQWRSYPSKYY
jgi:hypothetical protein